MQEKQKELAVSAALAIGSVIMLLLLLEAGSILIGLKTEGITPYYLDGRVAEGVFAPSACSPASKNASVITKDSTGDINFRTFYSTDNPIRLASEKEASSLGDLGGEYVVASIGDSFTFAYVEPNETFSAVLEQGANGEGANAKVLNFGVAGATVGDYLTILRQSALRYKPKLILVNLFTGNDIGQGFDADGLIAKSRANVSLCEQNKPFSLKNWALDAMGYSRFLSFIKQRILVIYHQRLMRDEYYSAYLSDTNASREKYERVFNTLLEMRRVAQENNATLVVSLIPEAMELDGGAWNSYFGADFAKYSPSVPQRLLKEFGEREGIVVLDPLSEYRERKQGFSELYYEHDLHFNKAGNEKFGELLYLLMKEKGLFGERPSN